MYVMNTIQNLLVLYAGLFLFNTALSLLLWHRYKSNLYKLLAYMWGAGITTFLIQGAFFNIGDLKIATGFAFTFFPMLAHAFLISEICKVKFSWKKASLFMCSGYIMSFLLFSLVTKFSISAYPIVFGVAFPIIHTALRAIKQTWKTTSISIKGFLLSNLLLVAHMLNFPIFRMVESSASIGFTIAIIVVFSLSIFAPSSVIEIITTQKAQSDAEIAEAQKLQSKLTPKNPNLPHLNLDFQFTPSSHVGGDFLNIEQLPGGETARILLGDVTSHGMEAALGTFISNTILTVEKLKGSPSVKDLCSQLNDTLVFLNEAHNTKIGLTFVAMDIDPGYRARFFGSHDPMIWYRAASQSCEMVSINSFPFRLGTDTFDLSERDIQSIQLEKNDVLFMYTDGLTEGRKPLENGKESEFFGLDRLKELVRVHAGKAATEISSAIREEFDQWTQKVYDDDVCFIVVKV